MVPLITIVTVCLNSEKTIRRTIESVCKQKSDEIEYLIIDGRSDDSTCSIINEYKACLGRRLRVISEKDKGWYDAMNKGIRLARGQFINFLNSDDYLDEDAVETVINFIKANDIDNCSIVYGDSTNVYYNSKGETLLRRVIAPDAGDVSLGHLKNGMAGIRHQSMFTGIKVFKQSGEFNLDYRLHADWDFLIKCIKENIKMFHINKNLTFYSMYGVSTNPDFAERHKVRKDNSMCGRIDCGYFKDRWGVDVLLKKAMGTSKWNDLLYILHSIGF